MPSPLHHLERSLRVRLAETLPGVQAQLKFAPTPARPGWRAGHFPPDTRTAAALLLLYPRDNDVAIPLTIRASGLARHAGQISLPGGATDEGETLSQTALREAAEEIGVDAERGPNPRRADAGPRRRQRIHAAPDHRRHRRAAGVCRGSG